MKHVHLWIAAITSALVWPCIWYWMILSESTEDRESSAEIGMEPLGLFIPLAPLLFLVGTSFAAALLYRGHQRQQLDLYSISKSWLIFTLPFACVLSLAMRDFMVVLTLLAVSLLAALVARLSLKITAFAFGRISPREI
nr:hypothetical protein [uncultured Albidiferax sp.]